mgnify:FL=1|tara:strand:+ start:2079 stop:2351 length:273 start_codon:yes stop_codon:yes gene_type:complete
MSTQEERRVGENVKLRKKLARALESEATMRAERRRLARRVRSYAREVDDLETIASSLRDKLKSQGNEIDRLKKYEDLIVKMVKRVQKDSP